MKKTEQQETINRILEWVSEDVNDSIKNCGDPDDERRYKQHKDEFDKVDSLIRSAPELYELIQEAKAIIYNLKNGLEKRSEVELMVIFDTVINKIDLS